MPTKQAKPLRDTLENLLWVKGRLCLPLLVIIFGATACQTSHQPGVETESIEDASSDPVTQNAFIPGPKPLRPVEETPHNSTGIVLLNPASPPINVPELSSVDTDSGESMVPEDGETEEPETLLIREPWPNPVARGGVEASDFGRRFDAVQFGYDSHDLDFAARQRLMRYCAWLEENPDAWVTLEGHCDERGSSDYNYNLGMTRAWTVKDWMVSLGIEATRLHTISYGEEQPLTSGHTPEAYAINRRVEFRPFYPMQNGRFLTSLQEGPDSRGEMAVVPPPQPALNLHAPDEAWPPFTE